MLVRPRYHWLSLAQGTFFLLFGCAIWLIKSDHFMIPFYFFLGAFMLIFWSNCFDVLTDESIERRRFFFRRNILLKDIVAIEPHQKNERWSYGKVFVIVERSGKRTNFQSTHIDELLSKLRDRLPDVDFLYYSRGDTVPQESV
jgi:hypothetical protein